MAGNSLAETDLGVLVDKLAGPAVPCCSSKGTLDLGLHPQGHHCRDGDLIIPLHSAFVTVPSAAPQLSKDTDKLECPREKHKDDHEAGESAL